MSKINVKQLGRDFKREKTQKLFKQIYDHFKPGIINYYCQFDNNSYEDVEDAYNKALTYVWNKIDNIDVEKYSISTFIYMRTKHAILNDKRKYKSSDTDNYSDMVALSNKFDKQECTFNTNLETDFLEQESKNTLWEEIKSILRTKESGDLSFNILYDMFYDNLPAKKIALKYNTNIQTVANRIFEAKKKIKKNPQIYEKFI